VVEREFRGPSAMRSVINNEELKPWIEAFMAIDGRRRDTAPLIRLLRDNVPMPWPAPWHLADLLERYNLKRPLGNPKQNPSYDYSEAWAKLILAKRYFKNYRYNRMDRDEAIEKAARKCGISVITLRNFIEGRYTSARRFAKRQPPPNPRP
jgi:hypothetical protein